MGNHLLVNLRTTATSTATTTILVVYIVKEINLILVQLIQSDELCDTNKYNLNLRIALVG